MTFTFYHYQNTRERTDRDKWSTVKETSQVSVSQSVSIKEGKSVNSFENYFQKSSKLSVNKGQKGQDMKPTIVADEMFPEGAGPYMDMEESGGPSALLLDLAANEKSVHADFFNDFEDLYDDEDLME